MVVYTERAPRRQQFHVVPAIATLKWLCNYTLRCIKRAIKSSFKSSFKITGDTIASTLLEISEERYIKAID